jgi:hypothetical protein
VSLTNIHLSSSLSLSFLLTPFEFKVLPPSTRARLWSLSWASWIHSKKKKHVTLSFHTRLFHINFLTFSGQICYAFLIFPMRSVFPAVWFLLMYSSCNIFWRL